MAKYRLVTRSDFDGLVCAILLKELNMIDEIVFVQPKDMQDGKVAVSERSRGPNRRSSSARRESKRRSSSTYDGHDS